jgi:hypothetical protein
MTYIEKSAQLAIEASVSVQILLGTTPGDCEFVPLRPKLADANMIADIAARWPGRGLRSVGVIGLCGTTPSLVLKEPLDPEQVNALGAAFLRYVNVLFGANFVEQREAVEIAELERLWSLQDNRLPN